MAQLFMILVCGGTAALLWYGAARAIMLRRRIAATPTTPLASVHEGHVEVQGVVEAVGPTTLSPTDGSVCAWLQVDVEAVRGAGKSREARKLLSATEGEQVWLRDDSGRGVIDIAAATVSLVDALQLSWRVEDDPPAEALGGFLADHGWDIARLREKHAGFHIEYQERRILVDGPLHVTGTGSRVEDRRGESVGYRGSATVARLSGPELQVSAASEATILRQHRRDAILLSLLGVIAAIVAALFGADLIRP